MKRPEYTAVVTDVYSKLLKENRKPTADEMKTLAAAFSRNGFTQGYFDDDKTDMFGIRTDNSDEADRLFEQYRKSYAEGEVRRVPVHFYTVVEKDKPIKAIAFDNDGNRATVEGIVPETAMNRGLTESYICDQMYKTGGTPYLVVENKAKVEDGLYASASDINLLRRNLISTLSEERGRQPRMVAAGKIPELPKNVQALQDPCYIFQVRTADQLTEELASLKASYIYIPIDVMTDSFELLKPFVLNRIMPVAVLPRIITDNQMQDISAKLNALKEKGISEVLCGNLGHVYLAKSAGMNVRGDFGLNVFNSYSIDVLKKAGLKSVTASFEMRIAQIKDLQKSIDTEMIAYGRFPLMVSEQCIIKESSGKCSCSTPGQMADRMGSVFPVAKEYGCRNVVYNAHKLYLADKKEDLFGAGLWGLRLMFTTEGGRECAEIARGYMGLSEYQPNVLTRGLYYRGVD